jgi:hypothetical protein
MKSSIGKSKSKSKLSKFDGVTIGDEYSGNDERPIFICNVCNCNLIPIIDSSGQNPSYYCNRCSIEYPETENLRKESKIIVPDRNIEPAVATTPNIPDISIRHEPTLKDGALALSKKGTIRFTRYEDSPQR